MAAEAAVTKYNNDVRAGNVDAVLSDVKDLRFQNADQVKANVQSMMQHGQQGFQCQILGAKKIDETHVLVTIQFTNNAMRSPAVEDVPVVYENGKWTLVFEDNLKYQHNHAKIRIVNKGGMN